MFYCFMEYSEVQEAEGDGDAANPLVVVPSIQEDNDVKNVIQEIIESTKEIAWDEVEEGNEDADANTIYGRPVRSDEFRGRRLSHFLFGSLLQLERIYRETRSWLVTPLWNILTDELLGSVGNKLPAHLRQMAIEHVCYRLMEGIIDPRRRERIEFFLSRLDCFKTINNTVLSTLTQLRGCLGIDSSHLAQQLQQLALSKGSLRFVVLEYLADRAKLYGIRGVCY